MCGIAGIVLSESQASIQPAWLETLAHTLKHRGPDDIGFLGLDYNQKPICTRHSKEIINAKVALVHTRLSIIDEQHGWQPMVLQMKRYSNYYIVFNGEIYNYKELKKEMESKGLIFSTQSDTEVLLMSYCHWGRNCLNKLQGMFAFTILDLEKRILFAARDPFGMKPFYYSLQTDFFAFASEIKALLSLPIDRILNIETAYQYLENGVTDDKQVTFFKYVHQLLPAHYLEINLDNPKQINCQRYWSFSTKKVSNSLLTSIDEASQKIKEVFFDSVTKHLRSDVLVAANLSGGIDSSSIVMMMNKINPQQSIQTFSYINNEPQWNEEVWVDLLAGSLPLIQHKVYIKTNDLNGLVEDIEDLIYSQDEPFGSTSILAQREVFKQAHSIGVKVTLDGQGADEIFAGYSSYLSLKLLSLIKKKKYREIVIFLKNAQRYSNVEYFNLFLHCSNWILPNSVQSKLKAIFKPGGLQFLKGDILPRFIDSSKEWRSHSNHMISHLNHSLTSSILPALLRYIDRNSMRFSIESRLPFLTTNLLELAYSLPEEYLITHSGETKKVFREAMKNDLPKEIYKRYDKISFQTPEATILQNLQTWAKEVMRQEKFKELFFIDQPLLQKKLEQFFSSASTNNAQARIFWRYLNFIRWADLFNVSIV